MDPEARVILFSANSEDPVYRNYREFGFCGIIEKPFELDDLQKVLGNVLQETSARAASS
jgi:DNA-binding NtrC family response regulator